MWIIHREIKSKEIKTIRIRRVSRPNNQRPAFQHIGFIMFIKNPVRRERVQTQILYITYDAPQGVFCDKRRSAAAGHAFIYTIFSYIYVTICIYIV